MSLSQICAEAEASISRSRSLFNGSAVAPPSGATDLSNAAATATSARARTTAQSGEGINAYQATTTRSTGLMTTAVRGDEGLAGHLITAAAVQQAGATRLDQISAQASHITKLAPLARSATAQRMVLAWTHRSLTESSQTVQAAQRQAAGLSAQIRAVDFKQAPPPAGPPSGEDKKDGEKKDGKDDDGSRKHSGSVSKSFGKGGEAKPNGPVQRQWGTPTDPHQTPWRKDIPFDGSRGTLSVQGPGRQGSATASQHTDGLTGQADVGAWAIKGNAHYDASIFGYDIPLDADFQVGAHGTATGAITDHGFSEGVDGFVGAEVHASTQEYHLGPLDLSLGASGQFGAGASEHLSAGVQDGKYFLGGDIGAAWGFGGKISPHIAIDKSYVDNALGAVGAWMGDLF
ncbi:hypothetical protein [Mycolicibacterium llatzerense]|uniref:hypothetical protein n=1 Tax=Mycolicibacterium llatzerense TaxID=280871 RepID=UPI0008DE15BC|nr:hypothetical protein [Mycolicibacterium llatzerense]